MSQQRSMPAPSIQKKTSLVSLLCSLNCEPLPQKISWSSLNVTHPDVSHLCRIDLGLLCSLALLSFFIELNLIGRKIRRNLLFFFFVFLFCFRNQRLNHLEILLRLAPRMPMCQRLLISFDGFGISAQMGQRIALVVPGLRRVAESKRIQRSLVVPSADQRETFPHGVLISLRCLLILVFLVVITALLIGRKPE